MYHFINWDFLSEKENHKGKESYDRTRATEGERRGVKNVLGPIAENTYHSSFFHFTDEAFHI